MFYKSAKIESNEVIVLLPGNPGIPLLYTEFMDHLYTYYDGEIHLYCLDYLGHVVVDKQQYSMADQVEHSRQCLLEIKEKHPNCILTVIGHSYGGYMAMELESLADKLVLLFPSIDDMGHTNNAQSLIAKLLFTKIGLWLAFYLVWLTSFIPNSIRHFLVRTVDRQLNKDQATAVLMIWNYYVIKDSMGLANEEFKKIKKFNFDRLNQQISTFKQGKLSTLMDKCYFVFTPLDGWCKIETFLQLIKKYPTKLVVELEGRQDGAIYITNKETPHAFCVGYSKQVAEIVYILKK